MARDRPNQKNFDHTWFLQEWMEQSHPPKKQADMIRELGWPRAKASYVYNGQQYTQALVDELSKWLNVRPWELLMSPKEAMELRSIRDAIRLASDGDKPAADERQSRTG